MKKQNNYIFIYRLICVVLATLSITFFWSNTLLVSILLILFTFLINIFSSKTEIISYIVVAILATLLEGLANSTGAWQYTTPHILNFPIWLPLYWGMGGLVMKDLYYVIQNLFKS
jgi:hypothetical protein